MYFAKLESLSFNIEPNQVNMWVASLKKDYKEMEFHQLLSTDERIRADKFYFEKDRASFIYARALSRIISSKYLNIPPQEIQFGYSNFGKPFYKHDTQLKFNLSHSNEKLFVSFTNGHEIGSDIEYINNDFDVLEIAQNFFSKNEIERLERISVKEQKRAFFRCWTRKEAFIKAEGSGLSFPLDRFNVSLESDNEATLLNTYWNEKEKKRWSLHAFSPYSNYLAAVATKGNINEYQLYDWDKLIDKY